jgi:hypothetical protein
MSSWHTLSRPCTTPQAVRRRSQQLAATSSRVQPMMIPRGCTGSSQPGSLLRPVTPCCSSDMLTKRQECSRRALPGGLERVAMTGAGPERPVRPSGGEALSPSSRRATVVTTSGIVCPVGVAATGALRVRLAWTWKKCVSTGRAMFCDHWCQVVRLLRVGERAVGWSSPLGGECLHGALLVPQTPPQLIRPFLSGKWTQICRSVSGAMRLWLSPDPAEVEHLDGSAEVTGLGSP